MAKNVIANVSVRANTASVPPSLKKVEGSVNKLNRTIKAKTASNKNSIKSLEGSFGNLGGVLSGVTGGASAGFLGMGRAITSTIAPTIGATTATAGLGAALTAIGWTQIVTVVTLVVGGLVALGKAFFDTQKGVDTFRPILEGIRILFARTMNVVGHLAGALVSLFKFDFAGVGQSLEDMIDSAASIGSAFEAGQLASDLERQVDQQGLVVEKHRQAFALTKEQRVEQERLKGIAQDTTRSIEERKKALRDALSINKEQSKVALDLAEEEKKLADLKIEAIKAELAESHTTIAQATELERQKTAVIQERQQIQRKIKTIVSETNTLNEVGRTIDRQGLALLKQQNAEREKAKGLEGDEGQPFDGTKGFSFENPSKERLDAEATAWREFDSLLPEIQEIISRHLEVTGQIFSPETLEEAKALHAEKIDNINAMAIAEKRAYEAFGSFVQSGIANGTSAIFEALGSGENVLQAGIRTIGGAIGQLGKTFIGIGTAQLLAEKIKLGIFGTGGIGLIVAGGILTALGAAIASSVGPAQRATGSVRTAGAGSSGGGGGGGGTRPRVPNLGNIVGGGQPQRVQVELKPVQLRVDGGDLVSALETQDRFLSGTAGTGTRGFK